MAKSRAASLNSDPSLLRCMIKWLLLAPAGVVQFKITFPSAFKFAEKEEEADGVIKACLLPVFCLLAQVVSCAIEVMAPEISKIIRNMQPFEMPGLIVLQTGFIQNCFIDLDFVINNYPNLCHNYKSLHINKLSKIEKPGFSRIGKIECFLENERRTLR